MWAVVISIILLSQRGWNSFRNDFVLQSKLLIFNNLKKNLSAKIKCKITLSCFHTPMPMFEIWICVIRDDNVSSESSLSTQKSIRRIVQEMCVWWGLFLLYFMVFRFNPYVLAEVCWDSFVSTFVLISTLCGILEKWLQNTEKQRSKWEHGHMSEKL